jgi:hypothetical protein
LTVEADKPASEPKNPSSAGAKSPVDNPRRYSTGSTSVTFGDVRIHRGKIPEENGSRASCGRLSATRGAVTSTRGLPPAGRTPAYATTVDGSRVV